MIHLAIVEDEEKYRRELSEYVHQYGKEKGYDFCITMFADGDEIVENYRCEYDIILLDIQMQFMDGMTAAGKIREQDGDVILLFITNMTNYAIKGYAVDALDYVLKPITYFAFSARMDRAMTRLERKLGEAGKSIAISLQSGGIQKIYIADLYYIESEEHVLVFHTRRGDFRSYGRIKNCEETLSREGFFRSNKGYLVNLRHVDGVRDGGCIVNGENLIISRARKKAFMEALTTYLGDR